MTQLILALPSLCMANFDCCFAEQPYTKNVIDLACVKKQSQGQAADRELHAVQELLDFQAVRPLRTVYALLEERGKLALLQDPLMEKATREIVSQGRSRAEIQRDIKEKERARDTLARRWGTSLLPVVCPPSDARNM